MPPALDELRKRLSDREALAFTLFGEARGEPIEGRIAVGSVIRNRAETHYRGTTIAEVCLWTRQFSCWWPDQGESNHRFLLEIVEARLRGGPVPWSSREREVYAECVWVAEGIVSRLILDRVHGARHYYAPKGMKPAGTVPIWARGLEPVATVGKHLFFVGVV